MNPLIGVAPYTGAWVETNRPAAKIRRTLGELGVGTLYIEPRSLWENGLAESFNSKLRDEFVSRELFESVGGANAWPSNGAAATTTTARAARSATRRPTALRPVAATLPERAMEM